MKIQDTSITIKDKNTKSDVYINTDLENDYWYKREYDDRG